MNSHLTAYVNLLKSRNLPKLAESVKNTAEDFKSKCLSSFDFASSITGLLLGNIQSGKTGQMFGIMCCAADNGFPVFLILTSDNNMLYDQTLDRVKADLGKFCICGENDAVVFENNNLVKDAVIVLKKNYSVLRHWADVFKTSEQMHGNPLFIFDDEADASSLNTRVNQGEQSSINRYISAIKNDAFCSIYLQVTGTAQSLFLQNEATGFHPSIVFYFEPGKDYLGGDFFFPESGSVPDCISLIGSGRSDKKEFDEFIVRHLVTSALIFLNKGIVSNALIHPSSRTAEHDKFRVRLEARIRYFRQNEPEFKALAGQVFLQFDPKRTKLKAFKTVYSKALELLMNEVKLVVLNSKNETSPDLYATGCNIVIGGNTLGRGVTFPALNTIYYTRTSKTPQADTIWQHSRMFGYDRDPGLIKVYITPILFKLFRDINAANNAIIEQITHGNMDVSIFYPKGIKPTRSNVLDRKSLSILSGGTNYFPFDPENDDIDSLDDLLKPYSGKKNFYKVPINLGIEILNHIQSRGSDFEISSFISALEMLENRGTDLILIVRRDRDIAKGTGAMLSPDDVDLGKKFKGEPVLTLYKVTGTKGWGRRKIWIPNIKLPANGIYYR